MVRGVAYEAWLVRVDVSDEGQEWSRFSQEANIEYLNLIAPMEVTFLF